MRGASARVGIAVAHVTVHARISRDEATGPEPRRPTLRETAAKPIMPTPDRAEAGDTPLPDDVGAWLAAARAGDTAAWNALYTRLYDELHRLARRVRAGRAGETLSTTALVHEAYFKLRPSADLDWAGRAHFFAVAARAMREVLVTAARRRGTAKRGGDAVAVTFGDDLAQPARPDAVLALDEALARLATLDARRARVVELRFFAGLTAPETAAVLGVSVPTVERDWRTARAWLADALGDHADQHHSPPRAARGPGVAL